MPPLLVSQSLHGLSEWLDQHAAGRFLITEDEDGVLGFVLWRTAGWHLDGAWRERDYRGATIRELRHRLTLWAARVRGRRGSGMLRP